MRKVMLCQKNITNLLSCDELTKVYTVFNHNIWTLSFVIVLSLINRLED